ncbi:MAG: cobyric acid synthase [Acidobacteria bacterium]|nr:cobyric acid synthase [Acidobacteriota bacterium]MCI0627985.1 cobyric acid synthase [Acidobacteriota bacterium]MCI0725093.1 cobyric acid synthase [Acidobacteriota bacterium]
MVLGTASHVGKSILVTALCRIFRQDGFRVAPFKAQNMALNSYPCKDGAEIGRSQVVQAEAAGVDPEADMNPILLKPTSDRASQVIVGGRVFRNLEASEYYSLRVELFPKVLESYSRLASRFELIVLEGAGSPVEMNLKENDLVNLRMAQAVQSPVLLVAGIDRGGVFASIVGTWELLTPEERQLVKGFVVNRFRGDPKLFESGVEFLERRTGVRVLGVIPYIHDLRIAEEDSVALDDQRARTDHRSKSEGCSEIRIGVLRLPRISNYTDFDVWQTEPGVTLQYLRSPAEVSAVDLLILPGTKNTIDDLAFLRQHGFEAGLRRHHLDGKPIVGICGGMQMLGQWIYDPDGVESEVPEIAGFGFLPIETVLEREKVTAQVKASRAGRQEQLEGYEIHMGVTRYLPGAAPKLRIWERSGQRVNVLDGASDDTGQVWGTYLHGIFDNDEFRREVLQSLRDLKKQSELLGSVGAQVRKQAGAATEPSAAQEDRYDRLARIVRQHLDMKAIYRILEGQNA